MCALDYGTITFMNEKKSKFLDSLMDNRLSFALKGCEFESSSIFLLSFNLLVCSSIFLTLCTHESGIRLFNKYARRDVNNFKKPK